jgi:hypothetical protein
MHTTYHHSSSVHISARSALHISFPLPCAVSSLFIYPTTSRHFISTAFPFFSRLSFVIPFLVLNNLVFHHNLLDLSASPHPPRTTLDRLRIRVTGADVLEYSRLVKAA